MDLAFASENHMSDPQDARSAENAPEPSAPPTLDRAVADLTTERQRRLADLLSEARRCDELAKALPSEAAEPVDAQRRSIGDTILSLLEAWQALGGTVTLTPPPLPRDGAEVSAPPPEAPAEGTQASPDQGQAAAEPTPSQARPAPAPQSRPRPPRRLPPPLQAPEPVQPRAHATPSGDWAEDLADLLVSARVSPSANEEMDTVQRAASASFTRWAAYPRSVQRALVGNLACRLRHLQDRLGVTGAKLDSGFRSLTRFSKSFQPGWVNGLTRGRGPAAESWADEARVWWGQLLLSADLHSSETPPQDEPQASPDHDAALDSIKRWLSEWRDAPDVAKPMCLEKTLSSIQGALEAGVPHTDPELCRLADEIYDHLELCRFRRLRQGIRDRELAEAEDQGQEPADAVPSDWPWWSHTIGRRALVLGCKMDQTRAQLVEGSFGLAELRCEVVDPSAPDELDKVLAAGGFDLVLLVGEHPHDPRVRSLIQSCQVRGTPWAHVESNIGVTRVRMAIERYLQPDPRNEGAGS